MFRVEVVKCSGTDHKVKCLSEAVEAVRRAKDGNEFRNDRKVSIRGAITDPCGCHLDALIWLASDTYDNMSTGSRVLASATLIGHVRARHNEMH